ncbi:MAG TPA: chlorite dismutase family protein [Gemmatimonadaceae bacterium]|nr:chlorite dismutase family protein [Gemmatimonadaceae bacterium]
MTNEIVAHPPETLEGWYALHQIFRVTGRLPQHARRVIGSTDEYRTSYENGWSARVDLIGSRAHLMMIHFYPTLEAIAEAQARTDQLNADGKWNLEPVYTFLSVTEAGLYHISAQLAAAAEQRGGSVGDDVYREELAKRSKSELESEHIQRRLYPRPPDAMPYVCFYPMSKRRDAGQNWYTLPLAERSRLMQSHGLTGRRYAGRVQQVITGAIGLDSWEWGVTLFAKDPIDFKKLVTDMRFDEVSATYAEFGEFFVGKLIAIL